mgnify:CR=1 FL=1
MSAPPARPRRSTRSPYEGRFLERLPWPAWLARDGALVAANGALAELLGSPREELRGRPLATLAAGADVGGASWLRACQAPAAPSLIRAPLPDGRSALHLVAPLPSGELLGILVLARDGAPPARHPLLSYEEIVERTSDIVFVLDSEATILWCNRAIESVLGYRREELIGCSGLELLSVKSLLPTRETWRRLERRELTHARGLMALRTKDGQEVVLDTVVWYVERDGEVVGFHGIARDVTETRLLRRQLRDAYEELATVIDSLNSVLIAVDETDRVRLWNRAAQDVFGFQRDWVRGQEIPLEAMVDGQAEAFRRALAAAHQEGRTTRLDDVRYRRPNGELGVLGVTVVPCRWPEGEAGAVITAADVTERRLLERELARAQKLEGIGQLAAGIAHEINTPTQFVGDNLRFLQEATSGLSTIARLGRELVQAARNGTLEPALLERFEAAWEEADVDFLLEEAPQAVSQGLEGVARVTKIVQAMRDFAHPGSADEKVPLDLNKAIESTVTVARNEWKYHAELELDLDPSLPPVPVIPSDFNQVVLNLVVNAAHAVSDAVGDSGRKGKITVRSRLRGRWAEVRVEDTGCGIPEDIRDRIFDPFFTTKPPGRGTGQGLAICHTAVVERHGGSITVESEVGKGTTFIVRLPVEGQV